MIEHFINTIKPHIDLSEVRSILEVGSRDCVQAVEFSKTFPLAQIYSFEANPEAALICRTMAKNHKNIRIVESAALDFDGEVDFYPVDMDASPIKNIGASSIYKFSALYHSKEALAQKQIKVPCQRIDTWAKTQNINQFDLVWSDAEASDLLVLQGMGDLIRSVRALQVEVEFQELHVGQTFYNDIHSYLLLRGFSCLYVDESDGFRSDAIYVNNQFKIS